MKRYGSLSDFDAARFEKRMDRVTRFGGIIGVLEVITNLAVLGGIAWVIYRLLQFYGII